MAIALYGHGEMAGRFGMSLLQARDKFLAAAKELGLEPEQMTIKPDRVDINFYVPGKRSKEPGYSIPWGKLRELAYLFSVPYDHKQDPPWGYTLIVETEVPEGDYVSV